MFTTRCQLALLMGAALAPATTAFFPHAHFGAAFGTPLGLHPHLLGADLHDDNHHQRHLRAHTHTPRHLGEAGRFHAPPVDPFSAHYRGHAPPPSRDYRVREHPQHFDIVVRAEHPADADHFDEAQARYREVRAAFASPRAPPWRAGGPV